ncbi:MAG: prolyl oligopeptidase family serine peptidase [Chloroflexota bacterium]|nr:prolyl oligopeptidase family serine peptidase [Chloroflexota bacterium]
MQPYNYVRNDAHFDLELAKGTDYWRCYKAAFHSAYPSRYQQDNIARGEYYTPAIGGHFPLAILLHGLGELGERNATPCRMLARDLAKMGVASFVLKLVLPGKEPGQGRKRQRSMPFVENWLELYQVLVINARQVLDWAEGRGEVDAQRVAAMGVSAGGIAAAIAMAVDRRIKAGVFIVTGGNMQRVTWESKNPVAWMSHDCTEEQCHEIYSHYPQYLADVVEEGIGNVTPAKECFLFDPLTFAHYLRERPLLMINAEQDDFVPRECTLEFWERCGRPPIVWLPGGHNTIFRHYHSIRKEAAAFMSSSFGIEHEPQS